ncbi:hypothetical protein SLEP1_g39994 [Rubroshorea leprosula]|uniref:Uncharacterized protein n=1 Tax=Rubroshorea leprosula TaxID=152421 RepID=A0AAV5L3C4_9ROSI|nr:hypothetical protein SLEP1_g39994 [Rubroshorea leprosula]
MVRKPAIPVDFDSRAKFWITYCWDKEQALLNEISQLKKENLDLHREIDGLKNLNCEMENKVSGIETVASSYLKLKKCLICCIFIIAFLAIKFAG